MNTIRCNNKHYVLGTEVHTAGARNVFKLTHHRDERDKRVPFKLFQNQNETGFDKKSYLTVQTVKTDFVMRRKCIYPGD